MKITDMIELAQAGIKAKDVLELHKAGYTKEMILELSEEPKDPATPKEDSEPKEKESPSDEENINDKKDEQPKEEPKKEPDLIAQELERVKKELAALQEKNRHKDQSGGEPEDPTKHIKEYIETLMIKK